MLWSLLADALVVVHFGFTSFVIFGGFLTWRWRRVMLLHLPALAWGCWVELSSSICPLTPLENYLRQRGGAAGYSGRLPRALSVCAALSRQSHAATFSGCWRGCSSWLTRSPTAGCCWGRGHARGCRVPEPAEPFRQPAFLDPVTPLPENPRPSIALPFPGSSAVERRTVNPLVVGSIPTRGAN